MTSPALRARYLNDSVTTASPARLLVMLCDRLLLDLSQAEEALRAGDRDTGSTRLLHAQDIIIELRSSLNLNAWDGAEALAQIYSFVLTELIGANVGADPDRVAGARALIEPICDAWRQVSTETAGTGQAAGGVG
jgi:flagellar protein FliS